jgi:hypothetical protein
MFWSSIVKNKQSGYSIQTQKKVIEFPDEGGKLTMFYKEEEDTVYCKFEIR